MLLVVRRWVPERSLVIVADSSFAVIMLLPLRTLLHQSPRTFGKPISIWTLGRVAEVAYAEGIIPRAGSGETIRQALAALQTRWKRAKHWITSPDPAYLRKKNSATASSTYRLPTPTRPWGLRMKSGGAARLSLRCTPGLLLLRRCG
jgi:hypothetical protein